MSSYGIYGINYVPPIIFFERNMKHELSKLGIDSKVTITGNSVIYVEFESQRDMNLYKLIGNYKECPRIKFFNSEK